MRAGAGNRPSPISDDAGYRTRRGEAKVFVGMFRRLFSQFREAGLIVCQFTASNTGATFTATANSRNGATFTGSAGQYLLTLATGDRCRNLVVVGAHVSCPDEDDLDDFHQLIVNEEDGGVSATAGTAYFTSVDFDGTPAVTAIEDGSIVTITLIGNK